VTVLTRRVTGKDQARWSPGNPSPEATRALAEAHAVVNLAGAPIADGRWTASRKAEILASRVETTRALAGAVRAAGHPVTFLSGSAVGYYGSTDDETPRTERSSAGTDFLADVCRAWEDAALGAGPAARVVLLRTGIVLSRDGGALPQLALPFRLFAGGPAGSGRQYMSWIHEQDWVAMVLWALTAPISGPMNLTAPEPVTNEAFCAALARALHRPSWLRAPAFALRLGLGEMADALILGGQRVVPRVALDGGYAFAHARVDDALAAIYTRRS
jgi:uncharacterized protein (TIGR01777 family)